MNRLSLFAVGLMSLQLIGAPGVRADDAKKTDPATVKADAPEAGDIPNAVIISVTGKCEYSDDGVKFADLDSKHVVVQGAAVNEGGNSSAEAKQLFSLNEGAVVRTGSDSRVDVFFRRIGTTVRLQANTEVQFEKMRRSTNSGSPVMTTLLHLRKGRIFTVVRSLIADSTFEIRNAAGRSVVEGAPTGGMGRYIITADGTQVSDKTSLLPIKWIGEKGVTVIAPGQVFDSKEGKMLTDATPETVLTLIEVDELKALAEAETLR